MNDNHGLSKLNKLCKTTQVYLFIYLFILHTSHAAYKAMVIAHKTLNIKKLHADVLFNHFFAVRLFS